MKLSQLTACTLLALGSFACASTASDTATVREVSRIPTAEHTALQSSIGDWAGTVTWVMPDGSEQASSGSETVVAHGPFWTKSEFRMDMGPAGTYMGHGCHGYDPNSGKYVSTWIDSMGSYIAHMEGEMDGVGNLVTHWEAPNMQGVMESNHSVTTRSHGSYKMVFFAEGNRTMEINMKRK
ncbi:MAG: DUF1579 family protein [Planctomycetota bacterium]|nr:DUF1579 family protein [Planctomycetota bacterium]